MNFFLYVNSKLKITMNAIIFALFVHTLVSQSLLVVRDYNFLHEHRVDAQVCTDLYSNYGPISNLTEKFFMLRSVIFCLFCLPANILFHFSATVETILRNYSVSHFFIVSTLNGSHL